VTSSWFFLSTLNYDARSTTHQINIFLTNISNFIITGAVLVNNTPGFVTIQTASRKKKTGKKISD